MYLVFDVGATFIKYALMDDEGNISGKGKTPTDRDAEAGTPAFVAQIKKVYDEKVLDCDITGIAMGLPGQIDVERGIVYGGGGIKYLDGAHLGDLISEACGGVSVALENDGKCAALAELWLGNASTATNAVVVVVGTGIGGGIIIDRKIHRGKRLLAGELSYALMNMTREEADNVRCCEELTVEETFEYNPFMVTSTCTASSITYKASKIMHMKPEEVTGEMVYQWIDEGNQEIIDMVEDSYFSIAKLCCNLYMTIDPDVILELTRCAPVFFSRERIEPPFLLRFVGSGKELSYLHTVAWMDTPYRIMEIQRMKGERLIWLSDRPNSHGIELPRHHIFAVRQEDGTHRFFGSQEPEKI